jgi:hypothetical protein
VPLLSPQEIEERERLNSFDILYKN